MSGTLQVLVSLDGEHPLRAYLIGEIRKMYDMHVEGSGSHRLEIQIGPTLPPLFNDMQVHGNVIGIHSGEREDPGYFVIYMSEFLDILRHPDFGELMDLCKERKFYLNFGAQWNMHAGVVTVETLLGATKPLTNTLMNPNKMGGALSTEQLTIILTREPTSEEMKVLKQEAAEAFGVPVEEIPDPDDEDSQWVDPEALQEVNDNFPAGARPVGPDTSSE